MCKSYKKPKSPAYTMAKLESVGTNNNGNQAVQTYIILVHN